MAIAVYLMPLKPRGNRKRKKWALRWQAPSGHWRQESCRTGDKKGAEAMRRQKYRALNGEIELVQAGAEQMAWSEFMESDSEILRAKQRGGATVKESRQSLDCFGRICEPATPSDVNVDMIHQFIIERTKQVSAATVNKHLRGLKAAFGRAVKRELLDSNPFIKVEPLTEVEKDIRVLSVDELQKLAAAIRELSGVVYGVFLVALTTAMRIGELANLQWDDLDLTTGDLLVRSKLDWRTKSGRNRYEFLPEFVRDTLKPLSSRSWEGYVFADRAPSRWYSYVQKLFDKAVKHSGIKHATWHDLRETALTGMAEGGAGVWVLQRIAGHGSPKTTERHYVDVQRDAVRSVISRHGERLKIAVGA